MGLVRVSFEGDPEDLARFFARGVWSGVYPDWMRPAHQASSGTDACGPPAVPIAPGTAGRIERAPNSLLDAMDAWTRNMEDRRKRPASIAAFRETIESAILDEGWSDVRHLTHESVTAWLSTRRKVRSWQASTYNRHLCAFRSLTRFCAATDRLAKDPLALAVDADADAAPGSRALTADEARAIIREAMVRGRTDRRARGDRALYWFILFATGARVGEPALWRWGQISLDEPVPSILWLPSQHKNRTRVEVALHEEAVALLRAHRERVPHGHDDPVFPTVPPRHTFRSDRDRAGVPAIDRHGRRCSPHSARKSFETWGIAAGLNPRMVDYLMRHRTGMGDVYHLPTLDDQAAALRLMPRLWPESEGGHIRSDFCLTPGPGADRVIGGTGLVGADPGTRSVRRSTADPETREADRSTRVLSDSRHFPPAIQAR